MFSISSFLARLRFIAAAMSSASLVLGDTETTKVSKAVSRASAENIADVFEPYFTTKDIGQGDGLGLSIVYGLIGQLGGSIDLKSVEGQGTTFTLYLPRAVEHVDKTEVPHDPEVQNVRGATVLILEDEPDLRRIEVSMVENLGFRALEASNGREALALLREHGEIKLLITDIKLPGQFNGLDVAAESRKINPEIKILLMSGYPDRLSSGIEESDLKAVFIGKPFTQQSLADKIREALGDS